MTTLVFTSMSHQRRLSHDGAHDAAEQVARELHENPVLRRPTISVGRMGIRNVIGVQAEVQCNETDHLSVLMALEAADQEWREALGKAECEKTSRHSQLRPLGTTC